MIEYHVKNRENPTWNLGYFRHQLLPEKNIFQHFDPSLLITYYLIFFVSKSLIEVELIEETFNP